jgi:hypothetical protein
LWKSGDFVTEGTCPHSIMATLALGRTDLAARQGGLAEATQSHYLLDHETGAPWRRR